jgi:hypothetical protein
MICKSLPSNVTPASFVDVKLRRTLLENHSATLNAQSLTKHLGTYVGSLVGPKSSWTFSHFAK